MEYEDFIEHHLKEIDLQKSEINLKHSYLFLCGGLVKSVSDNGDHKSLRSLIVEKSSTKYKFHDAIVLAEEYKNYFEVYDDLLKFEEDIALFCSLIIVILESAGSLVEFGMFCGSETIRKKMFVLASIEDTEHENSFIYLGPLKYLIKKNSKSVEYYPKFYIGKEYDLNDIQGICDSIDNKFLYSQKNVIYDKNHKGNIFYLVYEIISLFFPIMESEIKCVLENVLVKQEVDLDFIQRAIFILKSFNFISSKKYGNYTFYYPIDMEKNLLKFYMNHKGGYQPGTIRTRKAKYFTENDKHELTKKRVAALRLWMEKNG